MYSLRDFCQDDGLMCKWGVFKAPAIFFHLANTKNYDDEDRGQYGVYGRFITLYLNIFSITTLKSLYI